MHGTRLALIPLAIGTLLTVHPGASGAEEAGCPPSRDPFVLYPEPVHPFTDVFNLWVRPELLRDWSADDFRVFMEAVFDSSRAGEEDVFPRIWNYFCHADEDTAWDGVRFSLWGKEVTRIDLYLKGVEGGPAHAGGARLHVGAYEVGPYDAESGTFASCRVLPPRQVAARSSLAHELVHLAHEANTGGQTGAHWSNEMMATASERVTGWRSTPYASVFDPSYRARGPSAPNYGLYRLLMAYLESHFAGDPDRPDDDLLYRWIRVVGPHGPNIQFYGLARALEAEPLPTGWERLPGNTGDERVAAFLQRLAVARYVDRVEEEDGRYGFGGLLHARDLNYFTWPDTNVMRVRCIPPRWQVERDGERNAGSARVYVDPVDTGKPRECRERNLGVDLWGSDYFVLAADPGGSWVGGDRLSIRIEPLVPLEDGWCLQAGYIAYSSSDSSLSGSPVEEIVELAAGAGPGIESLVFDVPAFGSRAGSVVAVVTLVEDPIPPVVKDCVDHSLRCMTDGGCSRAVLPYEVSWEVVQEPD